METIKTKTNPGLIVFLLFPALAYNIRIALSLTLIIAGLVTQYITLMVLPGVIILFIGNILLLVKGANNLVSIAAYQHKSKWEKVSIEHIDQIEVLHKKMRSWDRSLIDITSWMGCLPLAAILILVLYFLARGEHEGVAFIIISVDIIALVLPWFVTGLKRIQKNPILKDKITLLRRVVSELQLELKEMEVDYMMEFGENKNKKVYPRDIKCRIKPSVSAEDFLGMYIQVSMNKVGSSIFPYAYIVLVLKENAGVEKRMNSFSPPSGIIKEFSSENDVEVMIIRQYTTRTSGYHTKPSTVKAIVLVGLDAIKQLNKN